MAKKQSKQVLVRQIPQHIADARKVRYGGGMAPAALARIPAKSQKAG